MRRLNRIPQNVDGPSNTMAERNQIIALDNYEMVFNKARYAKKKSYSKVKGLCD